jgi:hypothetical protein
VTEPEFRLIDMTTPRKRRQVGALLFGLAGVGVIVAAAVVLISGDGGPDVAVGSASSSSPAPTRSAAAPTKATSFSAFGSITLKGDFAGAPCQGEGGFGDLRAGAKVDVRDKAKAVVASGELAPGAVDGRACVFMFTITGVPGGRGPYEVTLGPRPGTLYTESDLSSTAINLTVGS